MKNNKQYNIADIEIYIPKGDTLKIVKPFHIIIDEHDEYYVSLVTKKGLKTINRSQLDPEELMSIEYVNMVNKYNEICNSHKDFSLVLNIQDTYTEEELIKADASLNIIYSNVSPGMLAKSVELDKIPQKVKTK